MFIPSQISKLYHMQICKPYFSRLWGHLSFSRRSFYYFKSKLIHSRKDLRKEIHGNCERGWGSITCYISGEKVCVLGEGLVVDCALSFIVFKKQNYIYILFICSPWVMTVNLGLPMTQNELTSNCQDYASLHAFFSIMKQGKPFKS